MTQIPPDHVRRPAGRTNAVFRLVTAVLCAALGAILMWAALNLPERSAHQRPPVEERLAESGVNQPVTAVLLNFRGYDTWLEVGVLVVAALSVLALHRRHGVSVPMPATVDPVLELVARLLVPFMVLVSGFLLWAGTHSPGGAFQAGAVLGAAGVLLRLAGIAPWFERLMRARLLRGLALVGFVCFLTFGVATMVTGLHLLEYPLAQAGALILIIETGVTVSIAWTLAFLYLGATPSNGGASNTRESLA